LGQYRWAAGGLDDREGDVQDEPHDGEDEDPREESDTGIADADGLEEQAGMSLDYDLSRANSAAAQEALRELRQKAGVGGEQDGGCKVTIIGPGLGSYAWWRP
jgi:hypothetical protein